MTYSRRVPKLWNETIDGHHRAVRDATIDATASLINEHGLTAVTMSSIAARTGIGRATLYKYFPDIDTILLAWHERQVNAHLEHLAEVRNNSGPDRKLHAVLRAYAEISYQRHSTDPAALHRGKHMAHAEQRLHNMIRDIIAESADRGEIRSDIAADELASYCLHALNAASTLRSQAAVRRLVAVTLTGLRR